MYIQLSFFTFLRGDIYEIFKKTILSSETEIKYPLFELCGP